MMRRSTPPAPLQDGKDGQSALPVFVVDAVAGAVVAANAAGWSAWGLEPGRQRTAAAIDRAMPALQRLAARTGPGASETLTFWTPDGLLHLECRIEPVGPGSRRFLVHALRVGRRGAPAFEEAVTAPGLAESDAAGMPALARLAHEVRTPLSAAIAYAEVLKEEHFGPLADGRYREYARNIYESARHALSVIDGMLARDADGAGLPELAFRDLDPAGVIGDCLAVARPLAERAGLDLIAHFAPQTPRVIADEVSLKQMLLNLITNAIKFARPGDRVTLGAAYGADGCLRIEVADTGPGMAAPTLSERAACAPEDQAGRPDAGLGIGLPLTRALAEANGAALIVDSAPGRGTRVTIAFGKDRVVPV
jgi:two-component system, cell cycle sensor histidine kinase PleC